MTLFCDYYNCSIHLSALRIGSSRFCVLDLNWFEWSLYCLFSRLGNPATATVKLLTDYASTACKTVIWQEMCNFLLRLYCSIWSNIPKGLGWYVQSVTPTPSLQGLKKVSMNMLRPKPKLMNWGSRQWLVIKCHYIQHMHATAIIDTHFILFGENSLPNLIKRTTILAKWYSWKSPPKLNLGKKGSLTSWNTKLRQRCSWGSKSKNILRNRNERNWCKKLKTGNNLLFHHLLQHFYCLAYKNIFRQHSENR